MNHIENIKALFSKINPIYAKAKQADEEKRKRGEYFNVFNTLGLWSEEVRLHSAFLAELLNPNGSHGMGGAFLCQFLQLIIEEQPDYIQPDKVRQNIVERTIGVTTEDEGGRLDIIIEDGNHAIIIENKIYAGDQAHQLLRYDNYGKKHFPAPGDYHLIYLTLDGHEASVVSTGDQNSARPKSYRENILTWLHKCVQLAYDKPLVRETIKQYIHLIKQLTNQYMETEYRNEIAELAIENLEATLALLEAGTEISTLLREQYIIAPLEQFAERNALVTDTWSAGILFKKTSWKKYGILITSEKDDWRKSYIGIVSNEEEMLQQKLECLKELSNNDYFPFGKESLQYEDWTSPSNYLAIKSGKVTDWIKKKIQAILQEIDEKHIQL